MWLQYSGFYQPSLPRGNMFSQDELEQAFQAGVCNIYEDDKGILLPKADYNNIF